MPWPAWEGALAEPLVEGVQLVVQPADQFGSRDRADVVLDEDLPEKPEHKRHVVGTQQLPRRVVATQQVELVEVHGANPPDDRWTSA